MFNDEFNINFLYQIAFDDIELQTSLYKRIIYFVQNKQLIQVIAT